MGCLFFLLFIFAIKAFTIPDEFRKLYQSDTKIGPISLFGASILAWSFGFFINWFKRGRRLNRDFLLFGGPLFALLFLTATWLILGPPFGFSEAVNRYFSFFLSIGTGANEQIYMQNQVLNSLNNDKENVLVYFEGLHEDPKLFQYHEVSSNLGYFNYWMLYFKNPPFNGCIAYIADKNELKKAYRVIYQDEYFENDALCAKSRYKIDTAKTTFKIEDFRAFQFRDKRILNITDQMLQKIRLNNI